MRPARSAIAVLVLLAAACAPQPPRPQVPGGPVLTVPAPLPDTAGWGVHVLALERAPNGGTWVGTYGDGIHVWSPQADAWRHIAAGENSISWPFVNSIAFRDTLIVWYGTVGNGFGVTRDGGATWQNWTFDQLGPQWQYVAPDGIVVVRDTVYIATADGLRISGDAGATWRCIQGVDAEPGGARPRDDGCTQRLHTLPNKYLLTLDVLDDGAIWVGHLGGLSVSRDRGATWTAVETEGIAGRNVRSVRATADTALWALTEQQVWVDSTQTGAFREQPIRVPGFPALPGSPRALVPSPSPLVPPAIATSYGVVGRGEGGWRLLYLAAADRWRPAGDIHAGMWWGPPYRLVSGSAAGIHRVLAGEVPFTTVPGAPAAAPAEPRHTWFVRPIHPEDGNTHIDQTYRYGSTMGGRFQQHQGVEFNNPAGTPVRAIGDGVVVYAGPAEQGALTVAIRHDRQWEGSHVFSTYYHNRSLDVRAGQRISAGDVIARVGNTGRATNDHLHLEVHVAPTTDTAAIVHPDQRFPAHTTNPQLWIQPLPGTGIVAGRVFDAAGQPVPGARIHGLVVAYPTETPFSFAETYRERARGTPAYDEHFAVGDVPAGDYTLGVRIDGARVWRRVRVQPGMVTWVEFRP